MGISARLSIALAKGVILSVLGGILILSCLVMREKRDTREMFRNRTGRLELPVVTYRHPETGREAVVVPTIHFAEASYYGSVDSVIRRLPRHRVLCEGIRTREPATPGARPCGNGAEICREIDSLSDSQERLAELLGLMPQDEGLPEQSSWENIDLHQEQLVRTFTENGIRFAEGTHEAYSLLDEPWTAPIVRWSANAALLNAAAARVLARLLGASIDGSGSYRVIVGTRDIALSEGIRSRLSDDLAIVWGVEHYPAIRRTLVRAGYRETARQWIIAYRNREYSLPECLAEAWSLRNATRRATVSTGRSFDGKGNNPETTTIIR